MPVSEIISARNSYAGKIRAGASPGQIEQARLRLEYAKAHRTITSWCWMPLDQRTELARILLAGNDQ